MNHRILIKISAIMGAAACCFQFVAGSCTAQIQPPAGWTEIAHGYRKNPEPKHSKIDQQSGFVVFTRHYLDPIYLDNPPNKKELTRSFHVKLAKMEYEPFVVGLYGIEDKPKITINILNSPLNPGLANSCRFEIRRIENRAIQLKGRKKKDKTYMLVPSLLKLTNEGRLIKGRNTVFWITVYADEQSLPGIYIGKIQIKTDKVVLRELDFRVEVLPFQLAEIPGKTFSMLYVPVHPDRGVEKNTRMILKDMRAHGMTSYSPIVSSWGEPLEFDQNGKPKLGYLVNHLSWAKEEGFRGPVILNVQKLIRAGKPKLDANYTLFDEAIDIPNLRKIVEHLENERQRLSLPEIVYLPIDEPGSFTDKTGTKREELAVMLLKTLNEEGVRGVTTVADLVDNKHRKIPRWKNVAGWWDKIKPYCSIRIYLNGYPEGVTSLEREMQDADKRGHEVWLYENSSAMGTDPRVSRMYFGFYGWATGVSGITSWTYPLFGNATVNHAWVSKKERKSQINSFYQNDGWRPEYSTVCWEMIREGVDDAKYLHALMRLDASSNTSKHVSKLLNKLGRSVDKTGMSDKKASCDWEGEQFSVFRKAIIEEILDKK